MCKECHETEQCEIWGTTNLFGFALWNWAERDGRGDCYGGAGWLLPDGSMCGACKAWVLKERIAALTDE